MRSATIKQNMTNAGVPGVNQVWCHEVGAARLFHGISITQRYPGTPFKRGMSVLNVAPPPMRQNSS